MTDFSLEAAYRELNIDNSPSLADEDVGVAFYRTRLSTLGHLHEVLLDALYSIAQARKSRFLCFLVTIADHLNEKNIAVLAEKTFPASPEPEPESVGEEVPNAESVGEGFAGGESSVIPADESSGSEMELDAYGENYATGEDTQSEIESPSSSEASINSSDGMSADSDFSEEVGDIYFDGYAWRCEECSTMLIDGKCPNGHEVRRCKTCGWQLDEGPCERCLSTCGACGGGMVDDRCGNCGTVEESEDEHTVYFDEKDELWRCGYCSWEVEADNETDGNCHCLNDKGEAHFIDLTDCLDYEPADSCSSQDDSSDSEFNSDDEGFIDDREFPEDGMVPDPVIETVNVAALYSAHDVAKIMKAQEMRAAAGKIKDKENAEPTASSDDIEVIGAQTANGQSKPPSNIVDCESMDT